MRDPFDNAGDAFFLVQHRDDDRHARSEIYVMAALEALLSCLFYFTDTRPNLDVAPESALALIRGDIEVWASIGKVKQTGQQCLKGGHDINFRTGVSVIIPVLNEEESIGGVIERIPLDMVDEIVVADGGSADRTVEVATSHGARVLHAGRGYGRACIEGAKTAGEDCAILVYMDGDGSDFPEELPKLIEPIKSGRYDFVIASRARGRREPGSMAWHQLASGRIIGAIVGLLYGFRYTDMCAFRAIRRDALLALDMREMTYGWNLEMQMKAARAHLRILEIPVPYACRTGGASKVAGSLRGTLRAGTRIIATLFRVALQPSATEKQVPIKRSA